VAQSLEEARKKLDDEYGQVRRHFDDIHKALNTLEEAGPEEKLEDLLEDLEDAVKKVRTGGLVGHGANGHTRALKDYLELKDGK
jgi:phosphohistidine phosphatase SixA